MSINNSNILRGSLQNHSVEVFYNGVNMGMLAPDGHTFTFTQAIETKGSSGSGAGAVRAFNGGIEECSFTMTVSSYNKNSIVTAFETLIRNVSGSASVNASSPFTGGIEGFSTPRAMGENALVIYPHFVDEQGIFGAVNTEYGSDNANPLAILMPLAYISEGLELAMNSATSEDYDLTFSGLVDGSAGNRVFVQDKGITSAGVYTPAV